MTKKRIAPLRNRDEVRAQMVILYREARRNETETLEAGRLVNILQTISNSFKEHDSDYRIAQLEHQIEKLTAIIDQGPRRVA